MKHRFILVTGGTRSGKSRFAVDLAKGFGRNIVYLATCNAADREMRQRISHHRRQRPAHWRTIEHPADPAKAITQLNGKSEGLILDCLTMYVSQFLVAGRSDAMIQQHVRRLCHAIRCASYPVIVVTNEVGSGVVPEFPMGRRFRDLAGLANQTAAACADEVYFLVAGIPMRLTAHAPNRSRVHASRATA
jgi:adenosylcobinamide kinase/adenosylcobinamide-phosphate guanylyltransferase